MKSKKMLSFLMAMLMLSLPFASCAETADETAQETDTQTPAAEEIVEEETEVSRENVKDTLPDDLDFNGAVVNIHTRGDSEDAERLVVEEMTGETINDTCYDRMMSVNERLNVELQLYLADGWENYNASVSSLRSSVMSGSGDFDIVSGWSARIPSLSLEGIFVNLFDTEYLNLEQEWWTQSAVSELTLGGKLYFCTGDITTSSLSPMCIYLFNQKVADDNQIENLYDVVKEHRWTIDYVYELTSSIYIDLDGNGQRDLTDMYGLMTSCVNDADGYMQGSRVSMMSRDEEGYPVFSVDEEQLATIVEKVYHLDWENTGVYAIADDGTNIIDTIAQDKALLATTRLVSVETQLADMESDYGILPYPLLDENQENYGTRVQDSLQLYCITIDAKNESMSGAVLEALAAEGWRTVTPAYFDKAMKSRYSRDPETAEMLDLIRDSIYINFESLYNESIGNPWFVLRTLMPQQNTNFASWWKTQTKVMNKTLDKAIKKLKEID